MEQDKRERTLEEMEALLDQLDEETAKDLLGVMQKLADNNKKPDGEPFDMIGALQKTSFWGKIPEARRSELEAMWKSIEENRGA